MTENFIVAGIGASAGGLDAFERLFVTPVKKCNAAFVLIQHLDPEHESYLADIIARYTDLPIVKISNGTLIEAGKLFINQANSVLTIKNRLFFVKEYNQDTDKTSLIDIFFASLAENYEERAVAVVLSGKGQDGSTGIETIKENGGLVLVQDPKTAAFSGMPQACINTGLVDYILPVEKIREKISSLHEYTKVLEVETPDEAEFTAKIISLLDNITGHDFSGYKESTVRRRLKRQMLINDFDTLGKYYQSLENNPTQCNLLLKELLIGVTSFFRDALSFQALENQVIIPLVTEKIDHSRIRIWVAGCSTGEETYSIALLIKKHLDRMKIERSVQIFATDINYRALDVARKGVYSQAIEEVVPAELLANYFDYNDGKYSIKKEIRDWVVFSTQSLVKDPPFSKIDLISCRNVLIYFGTEIQKRILSIFNYSLRSGGYLFLGSAENVGSYSNFFKNLDKNNKIYQNVLAKTGTGISTAHHTSYKPSIRYLNEIKSYQPHLFSQKDLVEKILLEQFIPSAVLVSENADVVYNYGKNSAFLEASQGSASLNILSMAKDGLKIPLTTAFKNAVATQSKQVIERVSLKQTHDYRQIRLSVIPGGSLGDKNYYLVVFEEKYENTSFDDLKLDINIQKDNYILRLEEELNLTREYLFRANEDLDISGEELKSANEELISANEELQSFNEELETSKEELQSMNEELLTVNAELDLKNRELLKSNYDLDNLFNNLHVGVLYLDNTLKIVRFTETLKTIINLITGDIGRPISHIVNNFLDYFDFITDLNSVVKTGNTLEKEIVLIDGSCYWMRIIPYQTKQNKVEGLVVTFNDISSLKASNQALKNIENKYLETVEMLPIGVYEMDLTGHITYGNASILKYFDYTIEDLQKGVNVKEMLEDQSRQMVLDDIKRLVSTGVSVKRPFYFVHDKHGKVFPIEIYSSLIKSPNGTTTGLRGVILDITEKLKAEEERQKNNKLESIGTLAGGIAHDFNNFLTAILGNISLARYQLDVNEKSYKLLVESEKAAIRARDLTTQLLTFAKGGNPLMSKTKIQGIIKESADFAARGSNCSLQFNFADNLWSVKIDKSQIHQVIQNLVINAIQSMPNGGKIFISAKNEAFEAGNKLRLKAGMYLTISIKDEGCGIHPGIIEKIYDPYFTTRPTCSGLGLSICYSVIKKHLGTIVVESVLNSGSEFVFYLPAFEKEIAVADNLNKNNKLLPPYRILFMDDELMLRTLAKELFTLFGLNVDLSSDGDEAVKMYNSAIQKGAKYDLVILDLTVPGKKGGLETLKDLLVLDPQVKAIVTSGYSNSSVISEYKAHGFVNFLAKPFNHEEVLKVLRGVFE